MPKPKPLLKKEVVPTATWGDVVVTQLLGSARLNIVDVPPLKGESAADRVRRVNVQFTSRLLNLAVIETDEATGITGPMYSAEEWDIWDGTHGAELQEVLKKAMELNGYAWSVPAAKEGDDPTVEDAAKNG